MKGIFLLFILIPFYTCCQNITFDQIQGLRKKSLAEVETYLTSKGWSMSEAKVATSESMGFATFGYNIDIFDSEKATSWITFIESKIGPDFNRITMQITNKNIYSTFLSRLNANGYKLKSSKIIDGGIKKIFDTKSVTCIVTTSTSEGLYTKSTAYSFFFLDNLDFIGFSED